jgi:hypothetical protein
VMEMRVAWLEQNPTVAEAGLAVIITVDRTATQQYYQRWAFATAPALNDAPTRS